MIEAFMTADAPVLRLACPQGFELEPDAVRRSHVEIWLEQNVGPLIKAMDPHRPTSYGWDFGRSGDLSVFLPLVERRDLVRQAPFAIELRNVPFREQEFILFWVVDRLPRFGSGKHDARGNGQALAEFAVQRYGPLTIEAVMLSQAWYLANFPPLKARMEDRTILLPRDADAKLDLRQVKMVRGVPKVPDDARTTGADGGQRHGDFAVACVLANAAMEAGPVEYAYTPASALPDDGWESASGGRALW
jgi:phage FluMu gp28-like protein